MHCPDQKPPSPTCAGTSREGGPYVFGAVSPVPDVFAKFQMQCSLNGPRCLCQTSIARLRRWLWHGAFGVERIPRRKYSSGEEAGDLRPATSRRTRLLKEFSGVVKTGIIVELFWNYEPPERFPEERRGKRKTHASYGSKNYAGIIPELWASRTLPRGAARKIGAHNSAAPLGPRT